MPIYEFACRGCHQEFEVRVSRVDGRPEACPLCGGGEFDRVLSTFAAHTSSGGASASSGPSGAGFPACGMGGACGMNGGGCGGMGMA